MKILVIGANGKIGRSFCRKASALGLSVRAMTRSEEQSESMAELGAEPVVFDLEGDTPISTIFPL